MKTNIQFFAILCSLFALYALHASTMQNASAAAEGAVIQVTTTADEFNKRGVGTGCSLREAIQAANTNKAFGGCSAGSPFGADTVQLGAARYVLTRVGHDDDNAFGDLDPASNLKLQGIDLAGSVIDGNGTTTHDRLLHIQTGPIQVRIENLTLTNGGDAGLDYGGGILNQAPIIVKHVVLAHNTANSGGGIFGAYPVKLSDVTLYQNHAIQDGGGMHAGDAQITRTTFDGNTAGTHGGGLVHSTFPAQITNSTFSGNRAKGSGGGIYFNGEGGTPTDKLDLYNVTLAHNTADSDADGSGDGGGIFARTDLNAQVHVANTLITQNSDASPAIFPTLKAHECKGTLVSLGYNLLARKGGCGGLTNGVNGDLVGTNSQPLDAKLDVLQNNGGAAATHALFADSPAVDAGNPKGCKDADNAPLITDERGYLRVTDGDGNGKARCDIGGYEFNSAPLPLP